MTTGVTKYRCSKCPSIVARLSAPQEVSRAPIAPLQSDRYLVVGDHFDFDNIGVSKPHRNPASHQPAAAAVASEGAQAAAQLSTDTTHSTRATAQQGHGRLQVQEQVQEQRYLSCADCDTLLGFVDGGKYWVALELLRVERPA